MGLALEIMMDFWQSDRTEKGLFWGWCWKTLVFVMLGEATQGFMKLNLKMGLLNWFFGIDKKT